MTTKIAVLLLLLVVLLKQNIDDNNNNNSTTRTTTTTSTTSCCKQHCCLYTCRLYTCTNDWSMIQRCRLSIDCRSTRTILVTSTTTTKKEPFDVDVALFVLVVVVGTLVDCTLVPPIEVWYNVVDYRSIVDLPVLLVTSTTTTKKEPFDVDVALFVLVVNNVVDSYSSC